MDNYWDQLMGDDAHAAEYMATYGEGPGFETRHTVGSFINDGESVLDVGCGPGWNLDHFMQYGPQISQYKGLDYSKRFVRVANKRAMEKAGTSSGPFEHGDARDLKEADGSFDVVLLQDCLEHTNGYEKPVTEALRVARKRVIISFWHLENTDNEHINDDGNDGWGAWYDQKAWEEYLNTLPYPWMELEVSPEGKLHSWKFYIIRKTDED